MPFGPTNSPPFYTAMMKDFKDELDTLFLLRLTEMKTFEKEVIVLLAENIVTIGDKRLIFGSKTIIDDVLLWCDVKELILIYFRCVYGIFRKYRVSFWLDKCEFLKPRVEYVGHDILCQGNYPAQSKFNLINDWPVPTPEKISLFFHRHR